MSAQIIAPILAKSYNTYIQTWMYPTILKVGQILPIFKSGAKDMCSNYRPISLLRPLTKIFEKCLYKRLFSYFEKFHILTHNQFGFKHNSSTLHAVKELYDEISESLNQQKTTCAIFLDLKKAFDTINRCILLKKLEKYGICGLPLQLIKSYLSNRTQYTIVNSTKSEICSVCCGVPQGSM